MANSRFATLKFATAKFKFASSKQQIPDLLHLGNGMGVPWGGQIPTHTLTLVGVYPSHPRLSVYGCPYFLQVAGSTPGLVQNSYFRKLSVELQVLAKFEFATSKQ
jgi:hypothetical protein